MGGIADLYKKIPTNIRLYGESMVGVDSPITEEDFTTEELEYMRSQIAAKQAHNLEREKAITKNGLEQEWKAAKVVGEGDDMHIEYEYENVSAEELRARRDKKLQSFDDTRGKTSISMMDYTHEDESILSSFNEDPAYRIWSSLGRYNAFDTPEGGVKISDIYDWDGFEDVIKQKGNAGNVKDILLYLASGQIRQAAGLLARVLATDKKRDVNINLPPKKQDTVAMPENYRAGGRVRMI